MKLLLILFWSLSAFADDFDFVKNLKIERPTFKKQTGLDKPPRGIYSDDDFIATLFENSIIYNIKTGEQITSTYAITVKAKQDRYDETKSYLYTKDGELKFWTSTNNLFDISRNVDFYPTPSSYAEYPPKSTLYTSDKKFPISSALTFSYDQFRPSYFEQYGSEYGTGAVAFRTTLSGAYRFNSKVETGLFLAYEEGASTAANIDTLAWTAASFGPLLRYFFYESGQWKYSGRAQIERSIFQNLIVGESSYKLSTNGYELGAEALHTFFGGDLLMGLSLRNLWPSIKQRPEGGDPFNASAEPKTNSAVAITLGYYTRFE